MFCRSIKGKNWGGIYIYVYICMYISIFIFKDRKIGRSLNCSDHKTVKFKILKKPPQNQKTN